MLTLAQIAKSVKERQVEGNPAGKKGILPSSIAANEEI